MVYDEIRPTPSPLFSTGGQCNRETVHHSPKNRLGLCNRETVQLCRHRKQAPRASDSTRSDCRTVGIPMDRSSSLDDANSFDQKNLRLNPFTRGI